MSSLGPLPEFPPIVGDFTPDSTGRFDREDLILAFRSRAIPLEALRYAQSPTGLHYLLTHFDIVFTGEDAGLKEGQAMDYQRSLTLEQIACDQALLVDVMNGKELATQRLQEA